LYTLQIETTDACPQGCVYCYAGSGPQETRALTTGEVVLLLEHAARLEIRAIDWLGGDPLVREDWHQLMVYARTLGLVNNVWTSGLPLGDPRIARLVARVTEGGFVSVHVDSLDRDIYARLHRGGNAGNIPLIIEGVNNLLAAGKPRDQILNCITYTALQPPDDAIATMRWWLAERGTRTCLTLFNPAGMGAAWQSLVPPPADIATVYAARDQLNFGEAGGSIAAMDTDKYYCGTMATVTFSGDVTPCSVIRKGVGNIRRSSFDRIVAEHIDQLVHAAMHDEKGMPAPCGTCADNTHCWGCRASAYHYGGDPNGPDPKCWVHAAGSGGRPRRVIALVPSREES
jgi:radical SAM protein with 4Fe4S-binding SPASM domain